MDGLKQTLRKRLEHIIHKRYPDDQKATVNVSYSSEKCKF